MRQKKFSKRQRILLKVILNAIEKPEGFIYSNVRWDKEYKENGYLSIFLFVPAARAFALDAGKRDQHTIPCPQGCFNLCLFGESLYSSYMR